MSGAMPLRRGVHKPLEDAANALIKQSLRGVTKHSDKADILTEWKEAERHRREVYVASGVPDPAHRRGMFHRSANPSRPDLNSREGVSRQASRRSTSLQAHVLEHGVSGEGEGSS